MGTDDQIDTLMMGMDFADKSDTTAYVVRGKFTASGTFRDFFDASVFGASAKTFTVAFGGPMYRYGDVVTSRASGLKLMVLRRVSGFNMRQPDQWECFALDEGFQDASRIGHWKAEEIE